MPFDFAQGKPALPNKSAGTACCAPTGKRQDARLKPGATFKPGPARPRITGHESQVTEFLIATPQIRNALKSFRISEGIRSNRNKSGGLKLGQSKLKAKTQP